MTDAGQAELVSVEAYLANEVESDIRHEYLGGYVYAMAGACNQHNRITSTLLGVLYNQLRGKPCQPFNSDTKVRIRFPTHIRFYYPDGMVVCDPNAADDSYQDRPVILAEVMSDSTRRTDESEKREAYQTIPTLDAYLIIESDRPRVVMHLRTEDGFAAQVYEGREAVVPLPLLGVRLPLAELYERVTFTPLAEE